MKILVFLVATLLGGGSRIYAEQASAPLDTAEPSSLMPDIMEPGDTWNGETTDVTVPFDIGSADLSPDAKEQIRGFTRELATLVHEQKVVIVAWADKEFPGDVGPRLSTSEERLAD